MAKSLFQKVWDAHAVRTLANGQTQLLIGTHLIHEVTSPQAFGMLRDLVKVHKVSQFKWKLILPRHHRPRKRYFEAMAIAVRMGLG